MVNEFMPAERTIYDHRKMIVPVEDGGNIALMKHTYLLNNFEDVHKAIMNALSNIWRNPFDLVKLWSIKFAEDPEKARRYEYRDAYESTDIYDGQGVAIYTYLHFKK